MLAASQVVFAHRAACKISGLVATYARGDDQIANLPLLPANSSVGMRQLREMVTFGARTPGFQLELAKLKFGETQWEPQLGDTVTVAYPSGNRTYTLKSGPNRRPWDWSDDFQQIITLYTVE